MKKTCITLIALLFAVCINAQSFDWAKSFGGSSFDDGHSITIDVLGNVYTTGIFQGTVDFDPGIGIANLTSVGGSDVFIQKLDASGNFSWAKSFGGGSFDVGTSITVDAVGNVYTTGDFQGTADFDPGVGIVSLTSGTGSDIFVQKLDSSGNFSWAKSFGGGSFDVGTSITVDAAGNVYTTGTFYGTVDFDPGAGTATYSSAGRSDIFVQKLDASGSFVWAKSFGGSFNDVGQAITVDASGNLYTTGRFGGTIDFNPGAGTNNLSSAGGSDIFVQKLDASGNFIWAKSFGGNSDDYVNSITLDALGNLYTTGGFEGIVDFDPGAGTVNLSSIGGEDIFVQKLDTSGNFIWAKSSGGFSDNRGSSITVDASGNIYTTGGFGGTVDFDPGAGTANLSSAGRQDIYVQKLDAFGNFNWATSFGNTLEDFGGSITVDTTGNIYTTGSFQGIIDFDPGAGTANLSSAGQRDIFVQKMSQLGTTGVTDLIKGVQVKAFPNPTTGLVEITFAQTLSNVTITITDLQGKVVYTKKLDAFASQRLNIQGSAGIYLLNIQTEKGHSVIKLIKD